MATLLLPAVHSPWVKTSIAPKCKYDITLEAMPAKHCNHLNLTKSQLNTIYYTTSSKKTHDIETYYKKTDHRHVEHISTLQ